MTLPATQADSASRPLAELVRVLPRALRWQASLVGLLVVWLMTWWQNDLLDSSSGAIWLIRVCAVIMALAAVFVLDDASLRTTESMVLRRRSRVGVRLMVAAVLVTFGCLVPAALAAAEIRQAGLWLGICIEVAGIFAVAVAVALVMQQHFGVDEPAQFVVLGLFALFLTLQALGVRWPMLVGPGAEWSDAHIRWVVLLALASGVVAWHLRDPAARGLGFHSGFRGSGNLRG